MVTGCPLLCSRWRRQCWHRCLVKWFSQAYYRRTNDSMMSCSPFQSREVEHFLMDQFEYCDNPVRRTHKVFFCRNFKTRFKIEYVTVLIICRINTPQNAKQKLLAWLMTTPRFTTLRVNTLKVSGNDIVAAVNEALQKQCEEYGVKEPPQVFVHHRLPEIVVVGPWNVNGLDLDIKQQEVIVDIACGIAVLRGADVFAPGVMGMQTGAQIGDIVSVFADVSKNCKKGLQCTYLDDQKYFVGNGIVKMSRRQLYGKDAQPTGVAVRMLSRPSGCPSVPSFFGMAILQNLPSIVTCHALDLIPGHSVLDCCAAPGNKTLHIASLMNDKGRIVAIDKTQGKVNIIKRKCEEFSVKCVETYVGDTTKSVQTPDTNMCMPGEEDSLQQCPLFPPESFDRVLLDAPCSALGQRPQLRNDISMQQLQSYPILQRKLFKAAYTLLKQGGYLVYSTCTVNVAENEAIVGWALKAYPELVLEPVTPSIGGPGIPHAGNLTEEQSKCVQRFGPPEEGSVKGCDSDTVGFFIARFKKKVLHHS